MFDQDAYNRNVRPSLWYPRRTRWTLSEELALLAGIARYYDIAAIPCTTLIFKHIDIDIFVFLYVY